MFFFKLTTDPILVFPLDRLLKLGYYAGKKRREYMQRQILAQINPWHIVHFSSDIHVFLAQVHFGKSLILPT